MTDRLTDLMHRAVDDLPVPTAPAARVLARGHAVRRARRLRLVASAAAVVVVVTAGVGATRLGSDAREPAPADPDRTSDTSGDGPVLAAGTTVLLDGGETAVAIDDTAVTSLYYTSAGVVVRHGDDASSDGGGPMRFSLVAEDGTVSQLPFTFSETVPSTDPTQPYLAYATAESGSVEVVVVDVRDGSEAARVAVPDVTRWGGWDAPPVSLDGDLVYVGGQDVARAVDWRTGAVSEVDGLYAGFPQVHGGHALGYGGDGAPIVVDVETGELLAGSTGSRGVVSLSPDGRYARVGDRVIDLSSQAAVRVQLPRADGETTGWSPADEPFTVDGDTLTTCSPTSGECTETRLELPGGELRLGGATYES